MYFLFSFLRYVIADIEGNAFEAVTLETDFLYKLRNTYSTEYTHA
jgi:hypothetical protein